MAYLITKGQVEIHRLTPNGKTVLAVLGPSRVFGEMALLDDSPRMASAVAVSEVECIAVKAGLFRRKLDAMDPFLRGIWRSTCQNARAMAAQYAEASSPEVVYLDAPRR